MMRTRKIVMLNGEVGVSIRKIRDGEFLAVTENDLLIIALTIESTLFGSVC
jgi:hypothetical protein